jgi:DNA-binding HxlR family transcriptional regulator
MDPRCAIERCLLCLGERWTFLIVREAFFGATRFAEWRERLGIAPDVLTDRLATHLTEAGRDLDVVLGAMQQWGDRHRPHPQGPSIRRHTRDDRDVSVGWVDDRGRRVPDDKVMVQPL